MSHTGATEVVSVHDEPRHIHCFENEYFCAYRVVIPVGDKSLIHSHYEDTAYIALAVAEIGELTLGATETTKSRLSPGICVCRHHRTDPLIHQVINQGETDMLMLGIELRKTPPSWSSQALTDQHLKLLWETDRLRAYKLKLEPGEKTSADFSECYSMIAAVSRCELRLLQGGEAAVSLPPGGFLWNAPHSQQFQNAGKVPLQAIVLEWLQATDTKQRMNSVNH